MRHFINTFIIVGLSVFPKVAYSLLVTDQPNQKESSATVPRDALQPENVILLMYGGEEAVYINSVWLHSASWVC